MEKFWATQRGKDACLPGASSSNCLLNPLLCLWKRPACSLQNQTEAVQPSCFAWTYGKASEDRQDTVHLQTMATRPLKFSQLGIIFLPTLLSGCNGIINENFTSMAKLGLQRNEQSGVLYVAVVLHLLLWHKTNLKELETLWASLSSAFVPFFAVFPSFHCPALPSTSANTDFHVGITHRTSTDPDSTSHL